MQFCVKSYKCVKFQLDSSICPQWSFVFLLELLFVPCCRLGILLFGTLLFHFWLLKLRPLFYFGLIKLALLRLVTARMYLVRYPCHNTLHICHNHHNRWLCKSFESSVKVSTGYMKESALSVICYSLQSYTWCYVSPTLQFYTMCNLTRNSTCIL